MALRYGFEANSTNGIGLGQAFSLPFGPPPIPVQDVAEEVIVAAQEIAKEEAARKRVEGGLTLAAIGILGLLMLS